MAFNRETIDSTRKLQNLPPISDEEFAQLNGTVVESKPAPGAEESKKIIEEPKVVEPVMREMTPEEILAKVSEMTGRPVKSWDELKPTPEVVDEEKRKEERESAKISWALQQKIVNKNQYEGFIADSKDPKDLVYRARLQEAEKEDGFNLLEFDAEFEEEFGLDQKEGTRRYKNGQDTLKRIAGQILKSTYGSVYDIENKYSQFEKAQSDVAAKTQKVKEGIPEYKKTLDSIKGKLGKITTSFSETETYEVDGIEDAVNEAITLMSQPSFVEDKILNGYKEEDLQDIAWTIVVKNNFKTLTKKIVDQALLRNGKGSKGLLKMDGGSDENQYELTDSQQKLKSIIEQNTVVAPAN
jgi:hypothetical protein